MDEEQTTQKPVKKINRILWVLGFLAIVGIIFTSLGSTVVEIDPFFHYRAPDTSKYFYVLDSQRYQNDGILRNFDYDAIIIGSSMAQNFKTSELDELFGVNSVKTTYPGGSFKETGDALKRGLEANSSVKMVVRSLDMDFFFTEYDDLGDQADGEYPTYLYDDNLLNDYKYVLNGDVIFNRVYNIKKEAESEDPETGITSFDLYSRWMGAFIGQFGVNSVCPDGLENYTLTGSELSDADKLMISKNITANILDIAEAYPDVEFYYFIPPYSVAWWNSSMASGSTARVVMAEQYVIELMLGYDNIHLYSFNTDTGLTTDLNNYKDLGHYGEWVNSAILKWMKEGTGLLTEDNYLQYIQEEYQFYINFDYTSVNDQEDYEDDYEAEQYVYGYQLDEEALKEGTLENAEIVTGQYNDTAGVKCTGSIAREFSSEKSLEDYLYQDGYVGIKLQFDDVSKYGSISFSGRKESGNGMPTVVVYDSKGNVLTSFTYSYSYLDDEWHDFSIDISGFTGKVTVIMNGSYTDNTGSADSSFTFSNIKLK